MNAPYRVQDRKYNRSEGVGETVAFGVQTCLHRAYRSQTLRDVADTIDARCAALCLQKCETTQGASADRSGREIVDSPYPTSWFAGRASHVLIQPVDFSGRASHVSRRWFSRESVARPYSTSRFIRDSVACLSSNGAKGAEMHDPPRATHDELDALQEMQGTLAELKEELDEEESVEDLKQKLEALKDQLKFEMFLQQKIQSPKKKKKLFLRSQSFRRTQTSKT
eukprot:CAMPEP_0194348104 /NCGR_PEP_ID=MMETSP0171-20130528/106353_1 /TAXON_ID=218684 /ORGANISM="Corethron pennatum, Strain L29A3" /LENGTH=223 /DNA_ID=CAMNT_0039115415 /DNA_START=83 /DNA_END=755 /DNA_ORIENTATION=-